MWLRISSSALSASPSRIAVPISRCSLRIVGSVVREAMPEETTREV